MHLEVKCRSPKQVADVGAGGGAVNGNDAAKADSSKITPEQWLCNESWLVNQDGHMNTCVGCKDLKPKKDKDATTDAPPKSALSNKSQQLIGATDPTKLQEEEEDAKTKQIAELGKELVKYKEYELAEIVAATEKQLSNLKSSSKQT